MKLRTHTITLRGDRVVLRPMTEQDWDLLLKWNNDPQVLYFAEGDTVEGYRLEEVQALYRSVSQQAYCFIIEVAGRPIGKCWLQEMNLDRILQQYPGLDCRRIDLLIGEQEFWGCGLGTEMIDFLTCFAFQHEQADLVFGCDIADYNVASWKAFAKAGYTIDAKIKQPPNGKAHYRYDLKAERTEIGLKELGPNPRCSRPLRGS